MVMIVDVKLFNGDIPMAVNAVLMAYSQGDRQNCLLSATGAHGIVTAHQDFGFRKILNSFSLNLADGKPAVWVGKLKGARQIKRCYGPDFFQEMLVGSRDMAIRHFFCGGKDGVAEELKQICEKKFYNWNVVGTYSPPFREMSDEELMVLANTINVLDVDIIWVGLSTPKQEKFAYRLSKYTKVHFLCTVGAAFDFHTGRLKQAPKWMQSLGLEWFFRLIVEPKRLWKRYFEIVPLFIVYAIQDLWLHFNINTIKTKKESK